MNRGPSPDINRSWVQKLHSDEYSHQTREREKEKKKKKVHSTPEFLLKFLHQKPLEDSSFFTITNHGILSIRPFRQCENTKYFDGNFGEIIEGSSVWEWIQPLTGHETTKLLSQ